MMLFFSPTGVKALKKKRIEMILDSFSVLPDEVEHLVNNSFLNDKLSCY